MLMFGIFFNVADSDVNKTNFDTLYIYIMIIIFVRMYLKKRLNPHLLGKLTLKLLSPEGTGTVL